jgi:hypothetical protein
MLFWHLGNSTKISDAKGAAMKIPEKIESGFISRAGLYYKHKMSATTNNCFFAKKEWYEKA